MFTATGVLLIAAAVAGWWASPPAGSQTGRTVVALVAVFAAACGVVAAAAAARPPVQVEPGDSNVEAILFAPVSYQAAAVVAAGAASTIGTAATQPWLTAVGVLAGVAATAVQMGDTRAVHRHPT
jgi:hypothetical protein